MKKKWSLVVAGVILVVLIVAMIVITMKEGVWLDNDNNNVVSGDAQTVIVTSGEQTTIKDTTIEVGDFVVENLKLEYKDGYTFVAGDILNNTGKDYSEGANFKISLYENEKLLIAFPVVSNTLDAGGRSAFNTQLTMDCTLATNIVVDLVEVQ